MAIPHRHPRTGCASPASTSRRVRCSRSCTRRCSSPRGTPVVRMGPVGPREVVAPSPRTRSHRSGARIRRHGERPLRVRRPPTSPAWRLAVEPRGLLRPFGPAEAEDVNVFVMTAERRRRQRIHPVERSHRVRPDSDDRCHGGVPRSTALPARSSRHVRAHLGGFQATAVALVDRRRVC